MPSGAIRALPVVTIDIILEIMTCTAANVDPGQENLILEAIAMAHVLVDVPVLITRLRSSMMAQNQNTMQVIFESGTVVARSNAKLWDAALAVTQDVCAW